MTHEQLAKDIAKDALDLAFTDTDWQDENGKAKTDFNGFCLVMFPDDYPLERYGITHEEFEEILYDAHKIYVCDVNELMI